MPMPNTEPCADPYPAPAVLTVVAPFSLALTCGPVAWVGHRSPRHAWQEGELVWVGWEDGEVVWRRVRQSEPTRLDITSNLFARHEEWGRKVLGTSADWPEFCDPTIQALAERHRGLRPYCDGSLFDGLVTAIVGQSISVAAAAITQARLAALFAPAVDVGGRAFRPLPRAEQLAAASPALIRRSGVTMRRAEALGHAARAFLDGELPADDRAQRDPQEAARRLEALPLVGRWTAASALLWGIGAPDAHPSGDVALLRAARRAYAQPALTIRELDVLAEGWQPARGWAARLLWTELFGGAATPSLPHHISL